MPKAKKASAPISEARPEVGAPALGDSLFRALFEQLPNPAYIWRRTPDDDFELVGRNAAASVHPFNDVSGFIGRRASELGARRAHDLAADLRACLATRVVVKREVEHFYAAADAPRALAVSMAPVCGTIAVEHAEDVTERRQAEQLLRESERKYRRIVDTAHEGICVADADGIVTFVNRRMAQLLGYSADEMLRRPGLDFVHATDHELVLRKRAGRRVGARQQFDCRLQHKDGSIVWVSVSAAPITDEHGRFVGSIGLVSDVTARRRAEQALRESEARVRALLDANPDTILRVTRDGRYLDVHARAASTPYLPAPLGGLVGRRVDELFDAEFAQQHRKHREAALSTGQLQLWEFARSTDAGVRHMEARFVKSGDDEVVITLRDITERVELEREAISSVERERERVGHDLHDGLAQLLTGIKLLLEPLKDKLAAERSHHASTVERAVDLVGQAIGDTRELARGLSPIPRSAMFADVLRDLSEHSSQLLGVRCTLAKDCASPALNETAATHLYRIAQEAITNAARHGRARTVRVACAASDGRVVLTVADDGSGIANTRPSELGLGLRIMRYRARSIGGDLAVTECPGGGTVVTVSCPLAAVVP